MASLIPSASASGTGSMTLAGPSTNSNQVLTIPDVTGTIATQAYAQGTYSTSSNGYQKLPSGIIIQWGIGNFSGGTVAITFPTAFPTSCLAVTACVGRSPTLSGYLMSLQVDNGTLSTTGVTIIGNFTTGGSVGALGNEQARWIAFGY